MSGNRVPAGYWVCDVCKSPNQSYYHPQQCPCGHYRAHCCYEAGSIHPPPGDHRAYSYTGPGNVNLPRPRPADAWYCPNCRAANSGLTPDFCPVCGYRFKV